MFKKSALEKRVEALESNVKYLLEAYNKLWSETHPPTMGGK